MKRYGFTLIELLVVMGIFSLLATITVSSLINPQTQSSIDLVATTLVAGLRQQQIKAMVGDSEGGSQSQMYGVHIDPSSYTLYRGPFYTAGDPLNFVVPIEPPLSASTTLINGDVSFNRLSGECTSCVAGSNAITIYNTADTTSKIITINQLGVPQLP